ncbi:carbonic anhydrase-like [Chanos chanos]|uniref:Carbonic anhydrase n=1 Tax=Chanos chanos TaxID=29144 RepID=A0A6J2VI00_CHACN|nr:carbonic anhydrase-like [Chanos chanos]
MGTPHLMNGVNVLPQRAQEHSPTPLLYADNVAHWGELYSNCDGHSQSPINIDTANVISQEELGEFTFTNFNSTDALKHLMNNGHTVQCTLEEGMVHIGNGGLNYNYSCLQFHFHWGTEDFDHYPGSEHSVDGQRYPVEVQDGENDAMSEAWKNFTHYLSDVSTEGSNVSISDPISIQDLLVGVDFTKYYRYSGSLTTPTCNEAVVWTVFHTPIKINRELLRQFPKTFDFESIYRPQQSLNNRTVKASAAFGMDSHTSVKCVLEDGMVEIAGGGLDHMYSTLQFHFHWGTHSSQSTPTSASSETTHSPDASHSHRSSASHGSSDSSHTDSTPTSDSSSSGESPGDIYGGSEHTVDSQRYSMEMHIVSKRKDLGVDEAKQAQDGFAVLGFFIEAEEGGPTPDAWMKFAEHLSELQSIDSTITFHHNISIDDLIGDVDRTSYYRYMGSLTTPLCNEAVVWTIFKDPIKLDRSLLIVFWGHARTMAMGAI